MELLILLLVLVCSMVSAAAAVLVLADRRRERGYLAAERDAAQAMEAEEQRRSRAMEEGVENLMRFSVNGQDGFGGLL